MSLQDLLNDAGGQTDTQQHRRASGSPTSLTSLLTTAKPIVPDAHEQSTTQAPQLPQATIRAATPEETSKPFNNVWTRIGQAVLPDFLQKELGIDQTQRQDKPLTTAEQERNAGNLITIKEMQDNPGAVSPLEYLRRGMSFGHELDPTTYLSGYQKDVGVENLPEPVTTKQKVAEAIGGVITMSLAQPLIEAGVAGLLGKAATYVPAIGKATEAVSTAAKLRPWAVGYPLSIAKATAEGGLFGLIEKNKETLAHNVLTTAGEFAAFTALAFPIQQFFKPIIEQVGKATLDNPTAQKVLGNPDVVGKPVAQTVWFRNPKDPTQLLKVTANGVTFTKTGGTELAAQGLKAENLPTMTSVQVEAFKENPSLYASLKDWVAGKLPKKTTIEFATAEDFAKAHPVDVKTTTGEKPSVVRDNIATQEAAYTKNPTPEAQAKIVEQRNALTEYQQTYSQPVVDTGTIRVQVLPFDDGKWDVSVNAKNTENGASFTTTYGSGKLYPSRDEAAKAGLSEVETWATQQGYDSLAKEAKTTASEPLDAGAANPPESSRMGFTAPQSVEDVQKYVEDGAKRYGSRNAFLQSDEYAAYHEAHGDQISSLYGQAKADFNESTKALAEQLGVNVGDRVETMTTGQMGGEKVTGTVRNIGGRYVVQLDNPTPVSKNGRVSMMTRVPLDSTFKKSTEQPTQTERVKAAVEEKPKTAGEVAKETGIIEHNVRRILGMGAKDGTFTRVEKGVYIINKDGQDIAYVHTADAIETLPKLAKEGVKVDMVFLDIPYSTKAVKGGNRGANNRYELISVDDFKKVVAAIAKMTGKNAPVIQMYSQAESGMAEMQKYNDVFIEQGWKPVAKGEYSKLNGNGTPVGFPTRKGYVEVQPEGIIIFTQSGELTKELGNLNFKLVRPKGYHTEKPAELLKSLIEMTTNEGETVLDPFAGSGVTGAEAIKSGRKAILIEKNADVVEGITKPRLAKATTEFQAIVAGGRFNGKDYPTRFMTHEGKPVDLGVKGEFMLHRPFRAEGDKVIKSEQGWTVSEATTGMTLFSGSTTTQKAAIEKAKGVLEKVGAEGLKTAIENARKTYGKPPALSEGKAKPPVRIAKKTVAKRTAVEVKPPSPKSMAVQEKEVRAARGDDYLEKASEEGTPEQPYYVGIVKADDYAVPYHVLIEGGYVHSFNFDTHAEALKFAKTLKGYDGQLDLSPEGEALVLANEKPIVPVKTGKPTGGGLASTGSDKIGNFEPVTEKNAAAYNLKLHEQVQELIKKFAARIGEGYLPRGTAGVMYPKTGSIRIGGMNDLSTAAHEIAHFIDQKFGITKDITTPEGYREIPGMGIMPIYKKEERWLRKAISDIYIQYYPTARREHPLPKRIVEGFATFVQKYMEMPVTIGEKYPKLVDAFFKPGGQYYVKDIEDLVAETRKIVDIYQGLDPLDKIGSRVTHDTQEVTKEPFLSLGDRIRTETVDNLFPLEKLAIKAGINMTPEDPSIWARAYNNSSAMVLTNINSDRGYWSFREGKFVKLHDYNWKTLVKQLESEKNGDAFNYFLIARDQHFNYQELAKLKEDWERLDAQLLRQQQGYELADGEVPVSKAAVDEAGAAYKELKGILDRNGFTEKEVTTAYEQNKDRFAKEADMFDALTREDLNFMNDTQVQLVDNALFTKLTSKEGYASLKRDFYDEVAGESEDSVLRGKGGVKASSLKQRKGSQRAILPPLDSAIRNHAEMTKKGLKQIVYNRIGDIGISAMFPDLFHVTELKAVPDGTGMIHYPQEKDPDVIMARRGYKRVPILTDRLVKRTVDEVLNPQNMGYFEQLVVGASRMFTKGTTGIYAPFALSNYTIDQITATAQSTQKYVPLLTPIKTLMKVLADRQDESEAAKYFMEYLVLGGERQTMIGWQDMSPRELERRIRGEVDGLTKVIDYTNKGLDVLGLPSKWSEIATRATEYIQARMNGSEAIVALEQAGRVTAPFHHVGRLGGSNAGKMFVKSIPFFNPALQVLDQSIRSGFSRSQAARQRYWFVTAAVIASLVGSLYVLNKKGTQEQKDLYKDLDPQMLVKYVFIPNPNGSTLIRVRVPDQMAVVGAVMNMAIADQIMNTKYDVGDYLDASTAWLPQQLQVNKPAEALLSWIPQILKPGIEVAGNIKDFPKVMPLESQSQQNKPAGLRFTEGTSPVAKWLGKEFNISPIKLDYLLSGYFGRATGYLTAKPGIYNPASAVNQIYYFSSGRRVQDFYDLRQKNDEMYNAYTHKLQTFPVGTPSKILRQRALIQNTYDNLKLYSNVDPEKDPQKAQELRQRILDGIDKVEAIKL